MLGETGKFAGLFLKGPNYSAPTYQVVTRARGQQLQFQPSLQMTRHVEEKFPAKWRVEEQMGASPRSRGYFIRAQESALSTGSPPSTGPCH